MGSDLHRPSGEPWAVAVVLHPHPAMGGDRHHPLVVAVAQGLAANGVAALRIDLTDPDPVASAPVLEQVAAGLAADVGTERVVLVGYSWGAATSARARPTGLEGRVLVAPPTSMLAGAVEDAAPTLVLVPAHDQFGAPDDVIPIVERWSDTTLEVVEGCDHSLMGAVDRIADRAVRWISDTRS
jgi:alpha/beta superfamily hydrolase